MFVRIVLFVWFCALRFVFRFIPMFSGELVMKRNWSTGPGDLTIYIYIYRVLKGGVIRWPTQALPREFRARAGDKLRDYAWGPRDTPPISQLAGSAISSRPDRDLAIHNPLQKKNVIYRNFSQITNGNRSNPGISSER